MIYFDFKYIHTHVPCKMHVGYYAIQRDIDVAKTMSSLRRATFGEEKHKCMKNLEAFHGSSMKAELNY